MRARLSLLSLLALTACPAPGEMGGCSDERPCLGRGEICDIPTATCVDLTYDPTNTGTGMVDFPAMPIPFLRGELCTVTDLAAGAQIPIKLTPLLHSCLTAERFEIRTTHQCNGDRCQAYAVGWVMASGAGCPPDVFGQFPPADGNQDLEIPTRMMGIKDATGNPLAGLLNLEVPYLSNDDIAMINAHTSGGVGDVIRELAEYYPPTTGRSTQINLTIDSPMPPENCTDEGLCTCIDIGL